MLQSIQERKTRQMNAEKIIAQIPELKEKIAQLEEIVEDYNSCKSQVTKKLLTSAIEKYGSSIAFKDV